MKIIDCEQRSDEWYQVRAGRVTASHFNDVMNKKSGRETYMMRLLAERLTGSREETYQSQDMLNGIELEPEAREFYEWVTGTTVCQVGFMEMDKDVGCSPDGLIGEDGLIEIKCPRVTTHIRYILGELKPTETTYKWQVQGQLMICKRKWTDFVSFCPQYLKQPVWIKRVEPDTALQTQLAGGIADFVTELTQKEKLL